MDYSLDECWLIAFNMYMSSASYELCIYGSSYKEFREKTTENGK